MTGESLGQVASQTLENMSVIQQAASLPVLRPLVGMDKQEIIDEARRIGTFEISSIPDQDCCQLFVPKHPATKARPDEVEEAEMRFDVAEFVRSGAMQASEKISASHRDQRQRRHLQKQPTPRRLDSRFRGNDGVVCRMFVAGLPTRL